jgi:hypothetical protein
MSRNARACALAVLLALVAASSCHGVVEDAVGVSPDPTGGSGGRVVAGTRGNDAGQSGGGGQGGLGGDTTPDPVDTGGSHGGGGPARDGGAPRPDACAGGMMPADVADVLRLRCQPCHGNPPIPAVPGSLITEDDFLRPAKTDPTRTMAELALVRITTTVDKMRMPPPPASPLIAAERQVLQRWLEAGMPLVGCAVDPVPPLPDGGALRPDSGPADARPADARFDPFAVAATCTSGSMYSGGTGSRMRPGENCMRCHGRSARTFAFAGTVYPSAHEPDRCYGADVAAQVVVIDGNGQSITASVNSAGNFFLRGSITPPLKAKVVFMGRERVMIGAVPSGACNGCHTQFGTTTIMSPTAMKAPGRILLP